METIFTLNDLADFYNYEKEYLSSIFEREQIILDKPMVSKNTIKNIQEYSKVLSIKETKLIGKIDFILN